MNADNTEAADEECDDDFYQSTSVDHASQTASTTHQFCRHVAPPKYV